VHINPLRHRISQPLERLASVEQDDDLVAVQAFAGIRGVLYGPDYRRHQVLAASGVVPDSPWLLVSKIDVTEAFAHDQRKEGVFWAADWGFSISHVVHGAVLDMAHGKARTCAQTRTRKPHEVAGASTENGIAGLFLD
jgi:hypothetical protein